MGFLDWSRRLLRLDDPSGWVGGGVAGGGRYGTTLRPMSPWAALQLGTVWSCVRVKSNTVGSLPCSLLRTGINNEFTPEVDHPIYKIVHFKPNADQTAAEFWKSVIAALDLWGNAFVEKVRNGQGNLVALNWLKPDRTTRLKDANGTVTYQYTNDLGRRVVFNEDDVWHIKGFTCGGEVGLSAIAFGRQTLSLAESTQGSAWHFFRNGMRLSGFFKSPGVLTDQQRKDFRQNVIERQSGVENTGSVGILEGGFDWVGMQMNPEEAQLLEARRFDIEEVCRWFDTPPFLIGHSARGQTMWGTGVEQIFSGWLTLTIQPLLVGLEQSAYVNLLSDQDRAKGLYIRFNFDALLRADAAARAQFLTSLTSNGIMTRNEARAKENLPKSNEPGADKLTVPVNLTTIEKLGQTMPGTSSNVVPFPADRTKPQ